MSEELYQQTLMEHMREPRNRRELRDGEVDAEGRNPLCGDQIRLALAWRGEHLTALHWDGQACGICRASASMMSGLVEGRTRQELRELVASAMSWFHQEDAPAPGGEPEWLSLASVRGFSMRLRCATLPWTLLEQVVGDG